MDHISYDDVQVFNHLLRCILALLNLWMLVSCILTFQLFNTDNRDRMESQMIRFSVVPKSPPRCHGVTFKTQPGGSWKSRKIQVQRHPSHAAASVSCLPPSAPVLLPRTLQDAVGPVEVPGGGRAESSEVAEGLAHGAGVVGQPLDVFESQVDDLVAARVAVQVTAWEALQAGIERDATLAVREVGAQRQGAGQGAALQTAGLAGAQLGGRPEEEGNTR